MQKNEFIMKADIIKQLGYQLVDCIADEFHAPSDRPIFPSKQSQAEMEAAFGGPVPQEGMDPQQLLTETIERVLQAAGNPNHPGLMANVLTASLPLPALSEILTASIKLRPTTWKNQPASCHIETTVARWLGEMIGYDDNAAGYITSGGSWANLTGMALARVHRAGWDVRTEGVAGHPPLVAYVSEQAHSSIDRAAELLGIGSRYLRKIPADANFVMRLDLLEAAIQADIEQGLKPFCVIGHAGTVNTGTIDPLDALADMAETYSLWFHVDGAYGALGALDPTIKPLLSGMARADSVTLDPHKWLNTPFEAGCILTKNWDHLRDTFSLIPPYLSGIMGDVHNQYEYGFELSRTDRALKVWLALKQYGVAQYADLIAEHNALARHMASIVNETPEFEMICPPVMSICCFRYVPTDFDTDSPSALEYLNNLNSAIEAALIEDGRALVSRTELNGRRVLRACISSRAVTRESVDEAMRLMLAYGRSLDGQMR
ncbi:MAG: pyridoxal-dependent decarboxylase [Chloroflexota bacterium]